MSLEDKAGEWIDGVLPGLEREVRSLALMWHGGWHGRELPRAWSGIEQLVEVLVSFIDPEGYEKLTKEHSELPPHDL